MRIIANVAVAAAISAGILMTVGGQATAAPTDGTSTVAGSTGSSSGSAGSLLSVLVCALQGGVTASTETSPAQCYPTP